ncbi:hypothetical protein FACS1894176_07560 [Bacteroidia bacterium]|nr:hypothetical protein FACS1894176_07560 [Bacteroidia bacterium]
MKKIILGSIAVVAIAAMAVFNVNLNSQHINNLSAVGLANIEALAQNESEPGWYIREIYSQTKDNGTIVSESEVVMCSKGGPSSSCTPSCRTRFKIGYGIWSDWQSC